MGNDRVVSNRLRVSDVLNRKRGLSLNTKGKIWAAPALPQPVPPVSP